jgi:hypothetical protein
VWMYKCSGDFNACDGSGKKWFKVRHRYYPYPRILPKPFGLGAMGM